MSCSSSSTLSKLLRPWLCFCLAMGVQQSGLAAPVVVVSIKPLQLIAAAIMDGIASPRLIMSAGQDPHEMVLRPSDRRELNNADLVLWIGPALELPLSDILDELKATILTTQDLDGLTLLKVGTSVDPHLWLNIGNVQVIARRLSATLQELDQEHAADYAANLATFAAALEQLQSTTLEEARLSPVQAWGVYHHAFRYLETELHLPDPLSLTDVNNKPPGIRGLLALREQLKGSGISCLLAEPGTDQNKVRNMLDMPELEVHETDIMGNSLAPSPDAFGLLYQQVWRALGFCSVGALHE